jgi:hypothetical protein
MSSISGTGVLRLCTGIPSKESILFSKFLHPKYRNPDAFGRVLLSIVRTSNRIRSNGVTMHYIKITLILLIITLKK